MFITMIVLMTIMKQQLLSTLASLRIMRFFKLWGKLKESSVSEVSDYLTKQFMETLS